MNITQATQAIMEALSQGVINNTTAEAALRAIREKSHYGNTMTADRRKRMLKNRFGI